MDIPVSVAVTQGFDRNFDGATNFVTKDVGELDGGLSFSFAYGLEILNLSSLLGATRHYAFPQFYTDLNEGRHASLTAHVDVLAFEVVCEQYAPIPVHNGLKVAFGPSSCNISVWSDLPFGPGGDWFHVEYCGDHETPSTAYFPPDHKQAILYVVPNPSESPKLSNWRGLVCLPNYNITKSRVTYSKTANEKISVDVALTADHVEHIDGLVASEILYQAFQSAGAADESGSWGTIDWAHAGDNPPAHDLDGISKYIEHVFSATGVELARRWILKPASSTTQGTCSTLEHRLFVHPLSFGPILTSLVAIILVVVGIIFF